jgi:hypothetical protein
MKNPLVPKRGVDKNGRQYTRLVKVEESGWKRVAVPSPTLSREEANEQGIGYEDLVETSQSIFDAMSKDRRANVTVEQVDAAFGIVTELTGDDSDFYSFRHHLLDTEGHSEWTHRPSGTRVIIKHGQDKSIRSVNMYSIDDYREEEKLVPYFRAEMALRKLFGLPEVSGSEIRHMAGEYWDRQQMHLFDGGTPRDIRKKMRESYIEEIARQPELLGDILDGIESEPQLTIKGNFKEFVEFTFYNHRYMKSEEFLEKFGKALDNKKWNEVERLLSDASLNYRNYDKAARNHVAVLRKRDAAEKRAAKKAAAAAAS